MSGKNRMGELTKLEDKIISQQKLLVSLQSNLKQKSETIEIETKENSYLHTNELLSTSELEQKLK
jgi:hypothetical protein